MKTLRPTATNTNVQLRRLAEFHAHNLGGNTMNKEGERIRCPEMRTRSVGRAIEFAI